MDNLDAIADGIRETLSSKDEAREKALPLCRDTIRHCSHAIRAVHRREFDRAEELLKAARAALSNAEGAVAPYAELSNAGFIRDAQKEFAEGHITLAVVTGRVLPEPAGLSVYLLLTVKGPELTGMLLIAPRGTSLTHVLRHRDVKDVNIKPLDRFVAREFVRQWLVRTLGADPTHPLHKAVPSGGGAEERKDQEP